MESPNRTTPPPQRCCPARCQGRLRRPLHGAPLVPVESRLGAVPQRRHSNNPVHRRRPDHPRLPSLSPSQPLRSDVGLPGHLGVRTWHATFADNRTCTNYAPGVRPSSRLTYARPYHNTGKAHRNTRWVGIPERVDPEKFEGWTAGQMRQSLEVIAEDCQLSYEKVWEVVRLNLETIAKFKEVHDIYKQNSRALKSYQAMMPSGADAELENRYAARFDRELARLLKWLEEAQRARNNDLPAPIRIDIG